MLSRCSHTTHQGKRRALCIQTVRDIDSCQCLWTCSNMLLIMWSPCYTRAISERFRDKGLIYTRSINKSVYSSLLLTAAVKCFRRFPLQRDNIPQCDQQTMSYSVVWVYLYCVVLDFCKLSKLSTHYLPFVEILSCSINYYKSNSALGNGFRM